MAEATAEQLASAKKWDVNGWFEVKRNPISMSGVFDYAGRNLPNAPDPDAIYKVWRPPAELSDPEFLESCRLIPWIDDHTPGMVGDSEEGLTPAEECGVHGVTGEDICYDNGVVYSNIKLFSESQRDQIEDGKTELSLGYRAMYDWTPGVTPDGEPYHVVQRKLRGNHLASVDDGRMGSQVAVLDAADIPIKEGSKVDDDNKELTLSEALSVVTQLLPVLQKFAAAANGEAGDPAAVAADDDEDLSMRADQGGLSDAKDDDDTDDNDGTTDDDDTDGTGTNDDDDDTDGTGTNDDDDTDDKKNAGTGLDAADVKRRLKRLEGRTSQRSTIQAIARRDKLAESLSHHVGVFDHSLMTEQDVIRYGVKKLGLNAAKGDERATLNGFLQASARAPKRQLIQGTGLDSVNSTNSIIAKYATNGGKA